MAKTRAQALAEASETMEAALLELISAAERFAASGSDEYQLSHRRRTLLIAARSYTRSLDALRRRQGEDS